MAMALAGAEGAVEEQTAKCEHREIWHTYRGESWTAGRGQSGRGGQIAGNGEHGLHMSVYNNSRAMKMSIIVF